MRTNPRPALGSANRGDAAGRWQARRLPAQARPPEEQVTGRCLCTLFRIMVEDLEKELLQTRKSLERQIEEGSASCNVRDAFDRIARIRKGDDPDDTLVQRGEA